MGMAMPCRPAKDKDNIVLWQVAGSIIRFFFLNIYGLKVLATCHNLLLINRSAECNSISWQYRPADNETLCIQCVGINSFPIKLYINPRWE